MDHAGHYRDYYNELNPTPWDSRQMNLPNAKTERWIP